MSAPQRILVVDDEPLLTQLFVLLLSRAGYEVQAAADGHEALTLVRAQPFELVLSDVMMPVMDGPSFLAEMLLEPDPPPFVFLTAYGDQAELALRASGAKQIVGKPVTPATLLKVVQQHARPRA